MGKAFAPMSGTDNSVLYVILSLFSLSIVNIAIIQSQLNALPNQQ